MSSAGPAYGWNLTTGGTDQKIWDALAVSNALQFRTVNDTNSAANTWMQVNRGNGFSISAVTFPSGNIGIGTTSPSALLEVNGNVKLTAGTGSTLTFSDGTTQSTAWTGVLCGGDYAESVSVSGERQRYEPGDCPGYGARKY